MYTKITYWLQNHQLFLVANLDNLSFVPQFVNLIWASVSQSLIKWPLMYSDLPVHVEYPRAQSVRCVYMMFHIWSGVRERSPFVVVSRWCRLWHQIVLMNQHLQLWCFPHHVILHRNTVLVRRRHGWGTWCGDQWPWKWITGNHWPWRRCWVSKITAGF